VETMKKFKAMLSDIIIVFSGCMSIASLQGE
jgi:hypothetical protein